MTGTEICNCGGVHEASERATQLVKKMIESGECPIFIGSVAMAFNSISAQLLTEISLNDLKEGRIQEAIELPVAMELVRKNIQEALTKGTYIDVINESITAAAKALNEEGNLPKGD